MSITRDFQGADFHLSKEKFGLALEALAGLVLKEQEAGFNSFNHLRLENIREAFWSQGFDVGFDEKEDIFSLTSVLDSFRNETAFFKAIGPFVTAGSYLEFYSAEEGAYRYAFNGEGMVLQDAVYMTTTERDEYRNVKKIQKWYTWFLDKTETFSEDDTGIQLAYLFGEMAHGGKIDVYPDNDLLQVLRLHQVPPSEDIWENINILPEEG